MALPFSFDIAGRLARPARTGHWTNSLRNLILLVGLVLALGAGAGLVVLRQLLDDAIWAPRDITQLLGASPLAVLPHIAGPGDRARHWAAATASVVLVVVVHQRRDVAGRPPLRPARRLRLRAPAPRHQRRRPLLSRPRSGHSSTVSGPPERHGEDPGRLRQGAGSSARPCGRRSPAAATADACGRSGPSARRRPRGHPGRAPNPRTLGLARRRGSSPAGASSPPAAAAPPTRSACSAPRSWGGSTQAAATRWPSARPRATARRWSPSTSPSASPGSSPERHPGRSRLAQPPRHRLLRPAAGHGLSDYLQGRSGPGRVSGRSRHRALLVLPAADPVGHSSELLTSPRMAALARELGRDPDRVVIYDCPPLLATGDPLIALEYADGCLLVLQEGAGPAAEFLRAAEMVGEERFSAPSSMAPSGRRLTGYEGQVSSADAPRPCGRRLMRRPGPAAALAQRDAGWPPACMKLSMACGRSRSRSYPTRATSMPAAPTGSASTCSLRPRRADRLHRAHGRGRHRQDHAAPPSPGPAEDEASSAWCRNDPPRLERADAWVLLACGLDHPPASPPCPARRSSPS